MIVWRIAYRHKGHWPKAVAFLKEESEPGVRVLKGHGGMGMARVVVREEEFESLADWEKSWHAFREKKRGTDFWRRFRELLEVEKVEFYEVM